MKNDNSLMVGPVAFMLALLLFGLTHEHDVAAAITKATAILSIAFVWTWVVILHKDKP
jgi:hypothetical protein